MRAALAWSACLAFAPPALAHNGFGIAPIFSEPSGIIVVDGEAPLLVAWTARENHPEQFYRLQVQAGDFPPTPSPPSALRSGLTLATLPSDAPSYSVPLDLSGLATGAWRLFAEYDEPPCVELEQVPALVVVQRPGDPPPFGVLVTEPIDDSPIVDAEARFAVEAISDSPVTVTIDAGDIMRDPDFPPLTLCVEFTWRPLMNVVSEAVLEPGAGRDRWKLASVWDTRAIPDGAYLLRVTARNASGATSTVWARRWLNVEHAADETPEAAPDGPAEPVDSDGGGEADATRVPAADDGCTGGAMPGVALSLVLGLTRRRR